MHRHDKRKLIGGIIILIIGFVLLTIAKQTNSMANSGITILDFMWLVLSPLGIIALLMILFGMVLLIRLAVEKIRHYFGLYD